MDPFIGAGSVADERLALAVLYAALLTRECVEALGAVPHVVLDGTFLRDPSYVPLLPGATVEFNRGGHGIASGAALLASGAMPSLALDTARALDLPGLAPYAARWRLLAYRTKDTPR